MVWKLCFAVSNIQTLPEIFVSLQFLIYKLVVLSLSQICQFCGHLLNKIAQKLCLTSGINKQILLLLFWCMWGCECSVLNGIYLHFKCHIKDTKLADLTEWGSGRITCLRSLCTGWFEELY